MNFLDIILIILMILIFIGALILIGSEIKSPYSDLGGCATVFFGSLIFIAILCIPFVVIDKASGSTVGTITSVDKNFFGTTAVYIRTTQNAEEEYCVENEQIAEQAKDLIGKDVKISYGTRIGLYSTGKCDQAPIDKLEVVTDGK